MSLYKCVLILTVFFAACKNDTPAKPTPTVEKTAPVERTTKPAEARIPEPPKKEEQTAPRKEEQSSNKREEPASKGTNTVTVSNMEELVANAKSNTTIYLKKGVYELESDLVYYMTKNERKIIDKKVEQTRSIGGQLFFNGLENFQLIGKKGATIVSKNPQAVAFFVVQGKNLKFSNLTVKKEIDGKADLSYFSSSQNIEIDRCKFDGGGAYGMYINSSVDVKVKSCSISKCTGGALKVNNAKNVKILNSTFSGNISKLPIVNFYGSESDITLNNVTISDNRRDPKSTFENSERLLSVGANRVQLNNCVIQNNPGYKNLGVGTDVMRNCQVDGVAIP